MRTSPNISIFCVWGRSKQVRPKPLAVGVSDRLWEIGDIVKLVEDAEVALGKRGPYKKQLT